MEIDNLAELVFKAVAARGTLRDEFARTAMQSIVLAASDGFVIGEVAKQAYEIADAMLARRERENG